MKTLTLDFSIHYCIGLRLKGISFKALKGTCFGSDVIRSDAGFGYQIEVKHFNIDVNTVYPKTEKVVEWIFELYRVIPFDKIKIIDNHHLTGEQLMGMILAKSLSR